MSMSHIWQNAERELATLRARVAELEAALRAERDAALATLARVRLTAGAWRDFASGIAEKAWTRESTEGREGYGEALAECAEEIAAVLGERDAAGVVGDAQAALERVREALTHSGDEPAIDTLGRIEAALRGGP